MTNLKKIVIVDDDPGILDAVKTMLELKGYRIISFFSGEQLLNAPYESPDLFILDKQLPGLDGLDLCRLLKSQESTSRIPVLILSASPNVGPMAKAALANEFLGKPFKMKALREVVDRLVQYNS